MAAADRHSVLTTTVASSACAELADAPWCGREVSAAVERARKGIQCRASFRGRLKHNRWNWAEQALPRKGRAGRSVAERVAEKSPGKEETSAGSLTDPTMQV